MNPLEYIEEGIREGNWETVCEGYERLTGKAIPLPAVGARQTVGINAVFVKALQQIYDIVSVVIDEESGCDLNADVVPDEKPKKKKPGRPRKSKKKKKIANEEDSSLKLNLETRTPGRNDDNKDIQAQVVQQKVDQIHLITNDPDPKEIEENKKKAEKANKNKVQLKRKPPETFGVECSECEQKFNSNRPQGDYGQKCKKCLNTTRR